MSRLWRQLTLAAALLFLAGLWVWPASGDNGTAVLQFNPPTLRTTVGDTVDVAVEIVNVSDLYGFDIAVGYDPAVVRVVDLDPDLDGVQMALGLFLDPGFVIFNQADNELGQLRLVMTQLNPSLPKSGRGNLMIVRFEALQTGETELRFLTAQMAQPNGATFNPTAVNGELILVSETIPLPSLTPIPSQLAGTPLPTMTAAPTSTPRPTQTATTAAPVMTATASSAPTAVAPTVSPTPTPPPTAAPEVEAPADNTASPPPTADATETADPTTADAIPSTGSPSTGALPTAAAVAGSDPTGEGITVVGSDGAPGSQPAASAVAADGGDGNWLAVVLPAVVLLLAIAALLFFLSRKARLER
jgi:hypothetical protein